MSQRPGKRASLETIENTNHNKRSAPESKQAKNSTFLPLPQEIRQLILTEVLADALSKDFTFMDCITYLVHLGEATDDYVLDRSMVKAAHLGDAAFTLAKVHPTFEDDVPFVLNKALAKIETYYDSFEASGSVWDCIGTSFLQANDERWAKLIFLRDWQAARARQTSLSNPRID